MFSTNLFSLLALSAASAWASDVFATFNGPEGAISPNFDVSNTGCFGVENAESVTFSQAGGSHFDGPYCLSAFTDASCPGTASAKQQFESLDAGTVYMLNTDIVFQGSYQWAPNGC